MQMQKNDCFGRVYSNVIRDKNIPATAKAIYAYFAVLCGASDECFPSIDRISSEMNLSKESTYKYISILVSAGVVERKQSSKEKGKFGPNVYRLIRRKEPCQEISDTENSVNGKVEQAVSDFVDLPYTEKPDSKNKQFKKNISERDQEIIDLYNSLCVSLPKALKLTENRKRAIHARFTSGYTIDEFKQVFELAESSPFLTGGNSRGWCANFDWLLNEQNFAKVLEGQFAEKKQGRMEKKDGNTGYRLF